MVMMTGDGGIYDIAFHKKYRIKECESERDLVMMTEEKIMMIGMYSERK